MLSYAVITPARNEEENIRRLGDALAAQTQLPAEWIVVDDGSTDGTRDVLAALGADNPWITTVETPQARTEQLNQGRREARPLDRFRSGVHALAEPVDVVIKVDADVDFDPDYAERLLAEFEADESLGIASGTCYERENGEWVRRTKADTTVWGASRAYRWSAVPDLMWLEPRMGWDGLDEIRVQLRGMTTRTFTELPFRHHRPEGGRELSSLHHGEALGRACWYMGYRPSYLAMRALYRARHEPAALAMLWGYAASAARREPQVPDARVIAVLRQRQRLGVALRRGAPAS